MWPSRTFRYFVTVRGLQCTCTCTRMNRSARPATVSSGSGGAGAGSSPRLMRSMNHGRLLSGLVGGELAVRAERGPASVRRGLSTAPRRPCGRWRGHALRSPRESRSQVRVSLSATHRASTVRFVMRSALRLGMEPQSLGWWGEIVSGTRDLRTPSDRGRRGPVSSAPPSARDRTVSEVSEISGGGQAWQIRNQTVNERHQVGAY